MYKDRKSIGKLGEKLAGRFLKGKGYVILVYNYRKKWGEIDIIAKKQDTYYFIEVKTRVIRGKSYENLDALHIYPHDSINEKKLHTIEKVGESYLSENDAPYEIHILNVYLQEDLKEATIEHLDHY